MSDDTIADFAARRWDKGSSPANFAPAEALLAAERFLLEHGDNVEHVIVSISYKIPDDGHAETFMQSGSHAFREQLGLLESVKLRLLITGMVEME